MRKVTLDKFDRAAGIVGKWSNEAGTSNVLVRKDGSKFEVCAARGATVDRESSRLYGDKDTALSMGETLAGYLL